MTIWRTIISMSLVRSKHQQEWVTHGSHRMGAEEAASLAPSKFIPYVLKVSRPVHNDEYTAGLDVTFSGRLLKPGDDPIIHRNREKTPEITNCLDELYWLDQEVAHLTDLGAPNNKTPAEAMADILAFWFHGEGRHTVPVFMLSMAREIIERRDYDLQTHIPATTHTGYQPTLETFMSQTRNMRKTILLPDGIEPLRMTP